MRWAQRQRQERIKQLVVSQGFIQVSDVALEFEVTRQTASADLAVYRRANPGQLEFNTRTKRYEVKHAADTVEQGEGI